jgi:hypothetical protein
MNEIGKREALKEELSRYREYLRSLLIVNIAIITGSTTVVYNVANSTSSIYMLLFVGAGLIALSIFISITKDIDTKIKKLIEELKHV